MIRFMDRFCGTRFNFRYFFNGINSVATKSVWATSFFLYNLQTHIKFKARQEKNCEKVMLSEIKK